jgi:hypothetical protein
MKFVTKNMPHCALTIGYKDKYTEEIVSTGFLGIHLDNHQNWKDHIDQIIPKLSAACYAVRQMYHFVNQNTLKSIYFAYFHSIVKYGIIFGVIHPTAGRSSLYKRKSSELWLGHILELHVEDYLKTHKFYQFQANIYIH